MRRLILLTLPLIVISCGSLRGVDPFEVAATQQAMDATAIAAAPGKVAPTESPTKQQVTPTEALSPTTTGTPLSTTVPAVESQGDDDLETKSMDAAEPEAAPVSAESGCPAIESSTGTFGDVLYSTDFKTAECWSSFSIPYLNAADFVEVELYEDPGLLAFKIREPETAVYAVYEPIFLERGQADVRISAAFTYQRGPNNASFGLVCRGTVEGWYAFVISTGGLWEIWDVDNISNDIEILASGGIDFRHYNLPVEVFGPSPILYPIEVTCIGDRLALYVNDFPVEKAQIINAKYQEGQVALLSFTEDGGTNYTEQPVVVEWAHFYVTVP